MDSRATSRHHWIAQIIVQGKDSSTNMLILLNHAATEIKLFITLKEVKIGHGLGVTK